MNGLRPRAGISRVSLAWYPPALLVVVALLVLPLFVIGALSRMSRLSLDERVRFLEALESSRVGLVAMLFVAIKVPMSIPALEEGEVVGVHQRSSPRSRRRRAMMLRWISALPP